MSQSINADTFHTFDPSRVPSPCFVIDKAVIERNLQCLNHIQERSGAKVLAALKAFSMWHLGPLTQHYLSGTCASGINEAKLGKAYYGGEVHTFSAAFKRQELLDVLEISDHIVFNTVSQWQRFQSDICAAKKKRPHLEFGLRINPRHSEGEVEIYDPCAPKSRLGISAENFPFDQLEGITGLHFHTLCEQGVQPLKRTLAAVEKQFGDVIHSMKWINFGGGHHITKPGYDTEELIELIKSFAERYAVQVYLEPGEAVAIHSGVLVCEVLDLTHNDTAIALLDTSATCHMPDTLEMPYRADIFNAGQALEKKTHLSPRWYDLPCRRYHGGLQF